MSGNEAHSSSAPVEAATTAQQSTSQPPPAPDWKPAYKRKRESLLPSRAIKSWMNLGNNNNSSNQQLIPLVASHASGKRPNPDDKENTNATKKRKTNPKKKAVDKDETGTKETTNAASKKKNTAKKKDSDSAAAKDELGTKEDTKPASKKKNTTKKKDSDSAADKKVNDNPAIIVIDEDGTDKAADKDTQKEKAIKQEGDDHKPNMSGIDRQHASFLSSMSAAAAKLGSGAGTKRSLAPPSPSPSVGSTTSAAAAGSSTPRKDRETPGNIVYSQPAMTGTGDSIISQMAYAVSWLRSKDEPQTCFDVLGYLSVTARPEHDQEFFVEQMRRHPQIQWIPDPDLSEQTWKSGTYVHRPTIPNVKNKTQLLAYLQKKTDASGVSVKDLKDGWPDCEAAINELEREHRLLVVRAKKDGSARMVWPDDPSLFHEVDPQLKLMWARTEVPSVDTIVQRLVAAQQKPASEDPRVKAMQAPKVEKKKKRVQRRPGKSTNVHMSHLLKDYSHMKR